MIKKTLKEKIRPQLDDLLNEEDKQYIEYMLDEVYYTCIGGIETLTLRPHPHSGNICAQFTLNGDFYAIHNDYEEIQRIGEQI